MLSRFQILSCGANFDPFAIRPMLWRISPNGVLGPNSQHRVSLTRFSVPLIPNTPLQCCDARSDVATQALATSRAVEEQRKPLPGVMQGGKAAPEQKVIGSGFFFVPVPVTPRKRDQS